MLIVVIMAHAAAVGEAMEVMEVMEAITPTITRTTLTRSTPTITHTIVHTMVHTMGCTAHIHTIMDLMAMVVTAIRINNTS